MPQTGNFENDVDFIIQNVARSFAYEGNAKMVSILANGKFISYQSGFDNWNGGTEIISINIPLPHQIFLEIQSDKENIEQQIMAKFKTIMPHYENTWLGDIKIIPELIENENWQEKAKDWLTGAGINNQGRVRSNNIASRECDGLLFRSQPEINFYKALKSKGIAFAPLPVFLMGGREYSRIEPDFIIIRDGIMCCIEIDGDTVHRETPSEAQARTRILSNEGVFVERFSATECNDNESAERLVEKIIKLIQKHKINRS